jgi:predicted acylesterase/phospholipase RssA
VRRAELKHRLTRRLALLGGASLAACAAPARLPGVPTSLRRSATVPGMAGARFYIDQPDAEITRWILATQALERGRVPQRADVLSISGGGEDGAFGAGLLTAWTRQGSRPDFRVVTGVSTGALTAPLAFLGPSRDAQLEQVYTTLDASRIFRSRPFTAAFFNDGMVDSRPLLDVISSILDASMLQEIADAYEGGRLLLVGTTDLDARRAVIWNIGAIARSGAPGALDLARRTLLASASVPGVFPPVMFEVEAGGQRHQEMHVDGGAVSQVFLFPWRAAAAARAAGAVSRPPRAWIIQNARAEAPSEPPARRTIAIAAASIRAMISAGGSNDVTRIWLRAERAGIPFRLAQIGTDFDTPYGDPFDPAYMRALFDYGSARMSAGRAWADTPPDQDPEG